MVAVAVLAALGLGGGWLVVLSGGFHHAPRRHASETVFVEGLPALAMAAVFFALSATGVAALVREFAKPRLWYFFGCGAVLLPPLLYVALA